MKRFVAWLGQVYGRYLARKRDKAWDIKLAKHEASLKVEKTEPCNKIVKEELVQKIESLPKKMEKISHKINELAVHTMEKDDSPVKYKFDYNRGDNREAWMYIKANKPEAYKAFYFLGQLVVPVRDVMQPTWLRCNLTSIYNRYAGKGRVCFHVPKLEDPTETEIVYLDMLIQKGFNGYYSEITEEAFRFMHDDYELVIINDNAYVDKVKKSTGVKIATR